MAKTVSSRKQKKNYKSKIDHLGRECSECRVYKTWDNYYDCNKANLKIKKKSTCIDCEKAIVKPKSKKYCSDYNTDLKQNRPEFCKARQIRAALMARRGTFPVENIPTTSELEVWIKSNPHICLYSGEKLQLFKNFSVDHRVPVCRGGEHTLENLCFASKHMNTAKGTMTEKEFSSLLELISTWEDKGDRLLRRLKSTRF